MTAPPTLKLWLQTLLFAVVLYGFGLGYNIAYRRELGATSLSESLALTAGVLIGMSFALSGMTYFFDFLDTKLKYRKYLGLVGYYCAVVYTFTLVVRFPDRYWIDLPVTLMELEAVLGITAMLILSFMAVISGNWAVKLLGTHWRGLLRLGYLAYGLLIIRAIMVEGSVWVEWGQTLSTWPPPRLLLSIFAGAVIALRLGLAASLQWDPKAEPAVPEPTTAPVKPAPVPTPLPAPSEPVAPVAVG